MTADLDSLLYNVASFVSGLFLLEYGADKFIDHTAIVAKRLNVSPTLVGLLTCGAEWEELVVIAVALGQKNSSLALGNLLGSSVANILASFSLGLLFMRQVTFDRSSKIYATVLLAATSAFLVFLCNLGENMRWIAGGSLIVAFVAYVVSIASLIYRGTLAAPEADSDDDSDSSSESDSESDDGEVADTSSDDEGAADRSTANQKGNEERGIGLEKLADKASTPRRHSGHEEQSGAGRTLIRRPARKAKIGHSMKLQKRRAVKPLWHHILKLLMGFAALLVSSYIIAHSANFLGTEMGLSGTIIGTTMLSLATTLPEKFVAILGGVRHQPGIMVANTVGSNIFLATLCGGVLFLFGDVEQIRLAFTVFEALAMWVSAAVIFVMVMWGAQRWMGVACLCAYVGFLVWELTHGRRLGDD